MPRAAQVGRAACRYLRRGMVDRRFELYWRRERRARERARASLPKSWVEDPRPAMADVRETFVEGMVEMRREPVGPTRS